MRPPAARSELALRIDARDLGPRHRPLRLVEEIAGADADIDVAR
jgi:hypothetical protein